MAHIHKRELIIGFTFGISFFIILILMFQPFFEGSKNFLAYSDDVFNQLTKGSSYFIPKLKADIEKYRDIQIKGEITLKKSSEKAQVDLEDDIKLMSLLLEGAGASVKVKDSSLEVTGDLYLILKAALEDADYMYWNNDQVLRDKYGHSDAKKILRVWHKSLSQLNKYLLKEKKTEEAKIINIVLTKGIEPGYNFFGINPKSIKEQALTLIALLFFYLFYTLWWGYAMVYLTEGLGLSTKKPKKKREV